MASSKSAMKRLRQSEKARKRHKAIKSELKTYEKKLRAAIGEGNGEQARSQLNIVFSKLDKAVKKGTIHRNKANRKKSRLSLALKSMA